VALVTSRDNKYFCGGSLLSRKLIITGNILIIYSVIYLSIYFYFKAAHCIHGKDRTHLFEPKDIFVIVGGHNLELHNEPGRLTESVKKITVHHDWNENVPSFDADIAMLELVQNITFNYNIQPICIISPDTEAARKISGLVVGHGKSENSDIEYIAKAITSPIYNYQFCAKSIRHRDLLTHRTFCGGYSNGTNVCVGDSGNGMVVEHEGIYYLRGIVSASLYHSFNACNIHAYSVFTDVLEFYNWVLYGTDDKILLKTTLEENKKLKSSIVK